MERRDGFVFFDENYAARIKRRTAALFCCLLLVPAALVVFMFLAPGFREVFLLLALAAAAADAVLVLANGLCYAERFCFEVTPSTLRVCGGLCCRKLCVLRYADVDRVRVRRYFGKEKVGADVSEYRGGGTSAVRFLSEKEAFYDVRLCCGSGRYDLKHLSQEKAAAVLSYFEEKNDERAFTRGK